MKKIFLAAMAVAAILASCSNNIELPNTPETGNTAPDADSPQVCITLQSDPATRAFFDDVVTATPFESAISSLTVYVFNSSGNIVIRRALTPAEVVNKTSRFTLPNSLAGTNCSFYVVANADYGNVANVTAMHQFVESVGLDQYNGDLSQIVTGRKRYEGFVMTGSTTARVADIGSSSTVGVTIKRTVAKIAVRTTMSSDFRDNHYQGMIYIKEVTLKQGNSKSYSYPNTAGAYDGPYTFTQTQAVSEVDGEPVSLFYAFETKGGLAATQSTTLVIKGVFDPDHSENTTADQSEVEYEVKLTGAGNGELRRNGVYLVDAVIDGLSGDAVTVNFTVADWETPVTQTVDLGN
jgi:hypothetical protein